MRRRIFLLLLLSLLICSTAARASDDYNGDRTVYVTATGECYHRRSCSYARAGEAITLQEAVDEGYHRCSRCRPLKLKGEPPVRTVITQDKPGVTKRQPTVTQVSDGISSDTILFSVLILLVFGPGVFIVFGNQRAQKQQEKERQVRRYLESDAGKAIREEYFWQGYQTRVQEEQQRK